MQAVDAELRGLAAALAFLKRVPGGRRLALVLDLAVKGVALAVLAERHGVIRFAVCAAAAARIAPVLLSAALPYARTTAGLGRALGGTGAIRCVAAVAAGAAVCVGLG